MDAILRQIKPFIHAKTKRVPSYQRRNINVVFAISIIKRRPHAANFTNRFNIHMFNGFGVSYILNLYVHMYVITVQNLHVE